jgi:hypothetical protein
VENLGPKAEYQPRLRGSLRPEWVEDPRSVQGLGGDYMVNRELLNSIQTAVNKLRDHLDPEETDRELIEIDQQLQEVVQAYE